MSMKFMVAAMSAKVGNPLRKLVLIKLADQANDQGECWPSFAHIADQCEMSRRSVIDHIKALEQAAFLTIEKRAGEKGNTSNVYHLHIKKAVEESPRRKPGGGAGHSPPPGAADSPGGVQEIHQGSAGDSPPPGAGAAPGTSHSFEPPIEPGGVDRGGEYSERRGDERPRAPPAAPAETFPMTLDWQPGPLFGDRCRAAGIMPECIPPPRFREVLGEFRSYWSTRPDSHTAARWEHKLLQQLVKLKNDNALDQSGGPHGTRQPTPQERRSDYASLLVDYDKAGF